MQKPKSLKYYEGILKYFFFKSLLPYYFHNQLKYIFKHSHYFREQLSSLHLWAFFFFFTARLLIYASTSIKFCIKKRIKFPKLEIGINVKMFCKKETKSHVLKAISHHNHMLFEE